MRCFYTVNEAVTDRRQFQMSNEKANVHIDGRRNCPLQSACDPGMKENEAGWFRLVSAFVAVA